MLRFPSAVALAACIWNDASAAAPAPCDTPSLPPTEVSSTAGPAGRQIHVLVGTMGTCDATRREFHVALPALQGIRSATAQLALAGFTRRYGPHQISFGLRSVAAVADQNGVNIRFTAAVEGLEGFQLAYTLYVTADH